MTTLQLDIKPIDEGFSLKTRIYDSLKAAMEGMTFEGPKGTIEIRAEDHMAIQDMYVVTLTGFGDTGPTYDQVATVRPVPPCLLEGDYLSRCGDLPVGSLGS